MSIRDGMARGTFILWTTGSNSLHLYLSIDVMAKIWESYLRRSMRWAMACEASWCKTNALVADGGEHVIQASSPHPGMFLVPTVV